jgi:TetR/AcrR family transcriptional regulator, mexJK operon transcriptional repressor
VGSKEALFLDVVDRMTGGAGDDLAAAVPQPSADIPPEHFLTRFAEEQLEIVVTPRLMQLRRVVIGEMARFPELGALLHGRGPARSIDRLAAVFAQFAEAGALSLDNPRNAAAFFNWLVMGEPVNNAMLLGDQLIPGAKAKKAHAGECVRIFMAAFQPIRKDRDARGPDTES